MFKIFTEIKNDIINKFGTEPMYEDQIKEYCKKNIPHFGGVFTHDKFNPEDGKCYILNTGNDKSPGYHWIGCVATNNNLYIFDSFHRNIHKIIKDINRIQEYRDLVVSKWKYPVQDDKNPKEENICGQLSLAWLECAKQYGIRNAMLI